MTSQILFSRLVRKIVLNLLKNFIHSYILKTNSIFFMSIHKIYFIRILQQMYVYVTKS